MLEPVQRRYAELAADPGEVARILDEGRQRAEAVASPRLRAAARAVGLTG
jgi:tryptophanyl-tRNA synthetase